MARNGGEDLDKIAYVLLDFFDNKRIVEALGKIGEFGVSGWEKWWQVELALFLSHADDTIAEWDMEHPFDTDRRTRLRHRAGWHWTSALGSSATKKITGTS